MNIFLNKKILIIGFGKSGYSLAKVLNDLNARVIVNELKNLDNDLKAEELKQKGVTIISGGHPLSLSEQKFDYVVKNPGIRYDNPLIQSFIEKGIPVITEIELGYMIQNNTIIGITGSNGKTTTTTLIRELFIQNSKPAKSAGNIGNVFTEVIHNSQPEEIIVTELSSFQLMGTLSFRPNISVLLNISEAHLDYHGDLESYISAKTNLITNQTEKDYCIYNVDDSTVQEMIRHTKAKCLGFSTTNKDSFGYFDGTSFYVNNELVCEVSDIKLKGKHNMQNILASICVAKLLDVSNESIKNTLNMFNGVEHRLQYVDTINNRIFYNDSKSTNLFATKTAINAFADSPILLMGGLDRGVDFNSFESQFEKIKAIISFGESAEKIKKAALSNGCSLSFSCNTIEEALYQAYSISNEGDVILLSPGCASWDQYLSFEERGYDFIHYVNKIKTNSHQLS